MMPPAPPAITSMIWVSMNRRAAASAAISRPRQAEEILQTGLGLTPGAARLVAALAADDDLQAFAVREGVTIHTARFHLRTALERTGAGTQAGLVKLVVRLLTDLGSRGAG